MHLSSTSSISCINWFYLNLRFFKRFNRIVSVISHTTGCLVNSQVIFIMNIAKPAWDTLTHACKSGKQLHANEFIFKYASRTWSIADRQLWHFFTLVHISAIVPNIQCCSGGEGNTENIIPHFITYSPTRNPPPFYFQFLSHCQPNEHVQRSNEQCINTAWHVQLSTL